MMESVEVSADVSARERMNSTSRVPLFPPRWAAVSVGVLGFLFFLAIVADQLLHGQLYRWNDPLRYWFHEHVSPAGVFVAAAFSGLGEFFILLPIALAGGAFLIWKKYSWSLVMLWAVAIVACPVMNEALKDYFRVPRPGNWTFYAFPPHAGYSFPSGHTMGSVIVLGTVLLFALRLELLRTRLRRVGAVGAFLGVSIFVPLALLAVGVHTLTEVLAGLGLSYGWLGMVAASLGRVRVLRGNVRG